jgi:hypothetical protein
MTSLPHSNSDLAAARLQKEQALAKLRALQTAALEGRLLDREQVRARWAQALAAMRDRALGMAAASRGVGLAAVLTNCEPSQMPKSAICFRTISSGKF